MVPGWPACPPSWCGPQAAAPAAAVGARRDPVVRGHLVRPAAPVVARLAELEPRRLPVRRPAAVTDMMPGARAVLVAVAHLISARCACHFRASCRGRQC